MQTIASLVKNESIDCGSTPTKSFDVFAETEEASAAEKAYLELKKAGVAKTTMDDLVWARAEDAEKTSGVKALYRLLLTHSCSSDPTNS